MKIIHLGTSVQTVFGRVDDQGNVVETFTVKPNNGNQLTNLTDATFAAAAGELRQAWNQLAEQAAKQFPLPEPSEAAS